ncbi:hypothetical protein BDW69DRAFT_173233, partial [Aspergillus filifer]
MFLTFLALSMGESLEGLDDAQVNKSEYGRWRSGVLVFIWGFLPFMCTYALVAICLYNKGVL